MALLATSTVYHLSLLPDCRSRNLSIPRAAHQTPFPPNPSHSLPHHPTALSAAAVAAVNNVLPLAYPLPTDPDAVSALIASCAAAGGPDPGRRLHHLISSSPHLISNPVITTRLLTMYAACGSPSDSRRLFDSLPTRNLFQWNAMISAYARNNLWHEALTLFHQLVSVSDHRPDNFTLPCVFKACAGLGAAGTGVGRAVHGVAAKLSLSSDVYVCNSLMLMYAKCGCVDEAVKVFNVMPERNLVSWNTAILGFSENGLLEEGFELFHKMMGGGEGGGKADDATVVTVLPMCAAEGWVEMGRLVHGLSVKLDFDQVLRVSNALIDMYGKCGCLVEAQRVFRKVFEKNMISWNVMIGGLARNGDVGGTFRYLRESQMEKGMRANEITVLNVLPACLEPSELRYVKELHGYVLRNRLESNELVPNALIAAYAKCGSLQSADRISNEIEMKTVSSWNAIIGGYAQNGDPRRAIDLFFEMTSFGSEPDSFSIGSLLLACAHLKNLSYGRAIHGFVLRIGLENDSFIRISLISLYVQCGQPFVAKVLFDETEEKGFVSWNTMIAGYSQNGLPNESLGLFRKMQQEGHTPSTIATTGALMACAQSSSMRLGKEVHCFALKANYTSDMFVNSSIIDMYAKCGSIKQARSFFDMLKTKDVVSWNVMVTGYGIHGFGSDAIELFDRMQEERLKPDAFTYVGILMACSHAGLVEEGLKYFKEMREKHAVEPKLEHYACVVDMLGRAGRTDDAAKLVEEMPEKPDGRILSALLAACRTHGNISLGEEVAGKLIEMEPDKVEHYILASNLFATSGRWDDVRKVRKKLKEDGLQKDPGCSWIDVGGKVYNFVAGVNKLSEFDDICIMWRVLEEKIRRIGYVPDTGSVLHEVEEKEKMEILRGHSEKQAITFGLLTMGGGVTVRVFKNIRMCRDCHNAAKLVSKVSEREIVVRDNKRFHHFRDGFCSCADYW